MNYYRFFGSCLARLRILNSYPRGYRVIVCIKFLSARLICLFFSPVAFALHVFGYRVADIYVDRIGHLAIEPDCLLKESILLNKSCSKYFFLAPKGRISNEHMLKYWRPYFIVITNPKICFVMRSLALGPFFKVDVMKYARVSYGPHAGYQVYLNWADRPPLLSLSMEDVNWGEAILEKIGVPKDSWFVCVHSRTESFSKIDAFLHRHRNTSFTNLDLAIKEIMKAGGWVIRIGESDPGDEKYLSFGKYIDYARSIFKSERMDIYLCAKAKFILGNTSGVSLVGTVFGVPCVLHNMVPITSTGYFRGDISFPKLHWSKRDEKFLNSKEIAALNLLDARLASEYDRADVLPVENTPEDVLALCVEMMNRMKSEGTGVTDKNCLTVNEIYKKFPSKFLFANNSPSKFSYSLMKKYSDLFW